MTSSSYWFYDVIKIQNLKSKRFQGFLLNISKTLQTDFHQTNVILDHQLYYILKIKGCGQIIYCCHSNQFLREYWTKNHDLKVEKWHFLNISNWCCVFELRFEIRSLKLPLTPNSSLIHQKKKDNEDFPLL